MNNSVNRLRNNNASLELLDDKVEVIPPVVREQSRVEAERDLGVVLFRALPGEVLRLTCNRIAKNWSVSFNRLLDPNGHGQILGC